MNAVAIVGVGITILAGAFDVVDCSAKLPLR